MKLLLKQEHAVYYLKDSETSDILYGGAAGGGKSALGCLWLIEMCQTYPGTRWLMGRSKLKTLKETTLATFNDLVSQLGIRDQFKYNDNKGVITHKNGSEIILKDLFLYPADPNFDSLGSLEITGAFIDECNQITYKAWQVVKSRIRFKLKENDLTPKILGSCNPAKNWVYSKFYLPSRNKELPHYMKFIQALPTDNPHLPKSYLEALLQLDENSKQRLYYGNWEYDNDPSALMSMQNIWAIFTNESVTTGDKFITADIARYGRDKTVIMVWDGLRCERIVTMEKNKVTEAADQIQKLAKSYNVPLDNIIVDDDGVGCLVKGTKVLTPKGWVKVEDIKVGDLIYSKDLNGNMILSPVKANTLKDKTDIIEDESGVSFAYSHFLPVKSRKEYDFKNKSWDYIVDKKYSFLDSQFNWEGTPFDIHFDSTTYDMYNGGITDVHNSIKLSGFDFATFLGYFISEGCIEGGKYIKITQNIDSPCYNDMLLNFKKLGISVYEKKQSQGRKGVDFVMCHKNLVKWLEDNCYTHDEYKSYNKKIPDVIKLSTKEIINEFLRAFNNGDGHFHKGERMYTTGSKQLSLDLNEVILKTGKGSNIHVKSKKGSKSFINGREITRKRDIYLVTELKGKSFGISPKIKRVYEDNVYNLEIDSPTKLYMVMFDGKVNRPFFVHNGGVTDILGCNGFVNNSTALDNPLTGEKENFQNLKSQMYFKLAEMINKGEIYVNCEDGSVQDYITKELEQVKQYEMDKDGKRRVMPKDKIKELIGRSPDYSDCLMMRMWFLYRKQKNVWFGWD